MPQAPLTKATFNLIGVVRYPDDYDGMEGGGKKTSIHALCEKTLPNGVSALFVINEQNSHAALDGTLSTTWRNDLEKAGVEVEFALKTAQTLANTLNYLNAKNADQLLPAITEVMAEHFPDRQLPPLKTPFIALNMA